MITVEEALDRIFSHIHPLGFEKVSILDGLGRVIAEDIKARRDIPPFNNSGMDGYAVRWEDVKVSSPEDPARLEVVGDLPAGAAPAHPVMKGQAIRIMTGAAIPREADTIIPVENTRLEDRIVSVFGAAAPGEYVRRSGEDVKRGERVIAAGNLIRPAEVGMLASLGRSFIYVFQRPLVAILCTGDELVDVDEEVGEVNVISSNCYALAAQVRDCGAVALQLGIARDRKDEIKERLCQGLRADVLISSAGVSVGNYDFVKDVFADLGMEMVFWKVAMKPGKPLVFGTIHGKPVFGLPGNPASSMISFEQFVRPSLLKMMGHQQLFRPVIDAVLEQDIDKEPGRRHFVRAAVSYEGGHYSVRVSGPQGSGILRSIVMANGLIIVPEDREKVTAGEMVKVQLLDRIF